MKRFEKIVAEQLKRGDIGTAIANSTLISKLKNKFKYGITVYMFIDRHGVGKKYPPLKADEVINLIPKNKGYKNYSNGEYVFVIDDQNPTSGKKETLWNVYIIDKKKTFPNISDQVFAENKSGQFNQSFIITFKQYDELLKKQAELVAAKEKADAEAAAVEKKKLEIKKTEVVVQNVIKGTETIDVNNLGKGTADAKAFQELLWQYGNKYETQKNLPVYTKFAFYRTQGADGGWDGDIGPATKNYITFLYAGLKVNTYPELIKKIRSDLSQVQTESTNYFKGMGMNIKLKDILREQLLKEQEGFDFSAANAAIGSGASGNTSTTKKKTKTTNYTPATFPDNYTGTEKITYKHGTYEGSWINGKKSGLGIFTSKTGKTLIGNWSNGKKNGEFKITYPNGDTRVGRFSNDVFSGPVTFTPKDEEPVEELWKDGKLLDIEDLYKKSAADIESILLKAKDYITDHSRFAGYKGETWLGDDDEDLALKELVLPWFQKNIQPLQIAHYNEYIKPYMEKYGATHNMLTIDYDLEFASANRTVSSVDNGAFRKMLENYLILKANSSDTSLKHPYKSAAYYNYAKGSSAYTLAAMFYNNYTSRALYYWGADKQKKAKSVDTDF